MTPEALERWRFWQARFKKLLGKSARVVSRSPRHTRPATSAVKPKQPRRQRRAKATVAASGEATAKGIPPPAPTTAAEVRESKALSTEQRLELLKVAASAPRPPKRPAPTSAAVKPPPPAVKPPAPSSAEKPAGREREPLGVGICRECRRHEPLFRHRFERLCRNCHPYGGQLDAA